MLVVHVTLRSHLGGLSAIVNPTLSSLLFGILLIFDHI